MSNVLVTGGAGYIGSHACKLMAGAGFTPITLDNLSTGWSDSVRFGPFVKGDLQDKAVVRETLDEYSPVAILHFAALSQVGESVQQPGPYWRNNVLGSLNLFEAAVESGCRNIILSSTCAVYGDQDGVVLTEDSARLPDNPYGSSKLAIEEMLRDFERAHGMRHVIFRYFNVAGADPEAEVGEFHQPETHLVPLVLDAVAGKRAALTIHGTDYHTPDGTCIRDFVHVMDLVEAHLQGLNWLLDGHENEVFNLGTGTGFSVREVADQAKVITNRDVPIIEGARREGDCAMLVSGSQKAQAALGWHPVRSDLPSMIRDAWRWHQTGHYDR